MLLQSVQKSWFVVARAHFKCAYDHSTLRAATLRKPPFVIICTGMKCLSHVREPDDICGINHKRGVGNHIFIVCSHLEALTRTLAKDLPGAIDNPEIMVFDTTFIITVIYIIRLA